MNNVIELKRQRAEFIYNLCYPKILTIMSLYSLELNQVASLERPDFSKSDVDSILIINQVYSFFKESKKIFDENDLNFYYFEKKFGIMNEIKFIVLFDVDDTMRDASDRIYIRNEISELHLLKKEYDKSSEEYKLLESKITSLWDLFFINGVNDKIFPDMIYLCNMYYEMGMIVKFRTGATIKYENETRQYLINHGAKFHELRMRKIGVKIPDYVLKPSWINKYDGAGNVFISYDDRDTVNEKYRSKGVENVIQITKDFSVKEHLLEYNDSINYAKSHFL